MRGGRGCGLTTDADPRQSLSVLFLLHAHPYTPLLFVLNPLLFLLTPLLFVLNPLLLLLTPLLLLLTPLLTSDFIVLLQPHPHPRLLPS